MVHYNQRISSMKKYVYIGLILSFSLCAEENPFSLNENLQKIDKLEKLLLLSFKNLNKSKLKKVSQRHLHQAAEKARLKAQERRKNEAKIQVERIAKAKKIREERAEAMRIKRLAEKKRKDEKQKVDKLKQEKIEKIRLEKEKLAKEKAIREELEKKRLKKISDEKIRKANEIAKKNKAINDKKKEIDKAYLDAIRDVN